ncbi:hypothetical protein TNCV_1418711 [Trichonephila clavipes]|nr:hypothetical protein TNCV_1418711 [Trichonephila clavipes]
MGLCSRRLNRVHGLTASPNARTMVYETSAVNHTRMKKSRLVRRINGRVRIHRFPMETLEPECMFGRMQGCVGKTVLCVGRCYRGAH